MCTVRVADEDPEVAPRPKPLLYSGPRLQLAVVSGSTALSLEPEPRPFQSSVQCGAGLSVKTKENGTTSTVDTAGLLSLFFWKKFKH